VSELHDLDPDFADEHHKNARIQKKVIDGTDSRAAEEERKSLKRKEREERKREKEQMLQNLRSRRPVDGSHHRL